MYKTNKFKRHALKTVSLNPVNKMSEGLPTFVAKYRRSATDSGPKVLSVKHKMTSIEEKKLRRFFKCTKFNLKAGLNQCFVCKNYRYVFEDHLKTKHTNQNFYCCYCNPKLNDNEAEKKYMPGDKLVIHMLEVHRHRRYQCNLCLYRAISAQHVDIHQSIIHSDIHKSTLNNKQLNGKSCKILECPPPTTTYGTKSVPKELEIFNNHKYRRLNNDENHNKDYQCVYCNYMNESITKVVDHCVQTHPDYYILYYVPEPQVTSTHSPVRQQQFKEIDLFKSMPETQDNRVTSTAPPEAVKDWLKTKENCKKQVEELSFQKKQRVSAVKTGESTAGPSGLSNKHLNRDPFPSSSGARRFQKPTGPLHKLGAKDRAIKRFNMLPNRPMPKSARLDCIKRNPGFGGKRQYQSDDSDDSVPPIPHKSPKVVQKQSSVETKRKQQLQPYDSDEELLPISQISPKIIPKPKQTSFDPKPVQSSSDPKLKKKFQPLVSDDSDEEIPHKVPKKSSPHKLSLETPSPDKASTSSSTPKITTTIEIVVPTSEEDEHEYVCLFCDQTSANNAEALEHLESHLPEVDEAMGHHHEVTAGINWVKKFVDSQMSLFEEEDNDDSEHHYKCPVCVKIARIKQLRPKRFRYFWELRNHFWEHTVWTPVLCLLCKAVKHEMPNCDYIVAKHLNAKHPDNLVDAEELSINRLRGNKVRFNFDEEQRSALHGNEFIKTNRYEPLDKQIEDILQTISEKREAQLRSEARFDGNLLKVILPKLEIKPLPALDYENDDMVEQFLVYNERQNQRNGRIQTNSTEKVPKKPIHVLDLGSSSEEEDNEEEAPAVITRKRKTVFEDSDGEENNDQNHNNDQNSNEQHNSNDQNNDSDDDIEFVAEIKCEPKSGSPKSDDSDEEVDDDMKKVISSNDKTRDKLKPNKSNYVQSEEDTDRQSEEAEEEAVDRPKQVTDTSEHSSNTQNSNHENDERCKSPVPSIPAADTPPSPLKRYQCSLCKEKFENKDRKIINDHYKREHPNENVRFERI